MVSMTRSSWLKISKHMDGMNKMGTRAVYFFEDSDGVYGVYKHYDNYPSGAMWFIENAKEYAWPFPRFEADDFAAGFVAANKAKGGGGCRLLPMFDSTSIDMVMEDYRWCDYYYVISWGVEVSKLVVEIYGRKYDTVLDSYDWYKEAEMTHDVMLQAYRKAS